MSEEVTFIIAGIYAAVVAISFRRVGMISAVLWPVTIILLGTYVFFVTALSQPSNDE